MSIGNATPSLLAGPGDIEPQQPCLPLPASNSLGPFTKNREVQKENICPEISPENRRRLLSILEAKN